MVVYKISYRRSAVFSNTCRRAGRAPELLGTLRDPSGLAVPAARMELRETGTGARYQTLSGPGGAWQFSGLLPGTYNLEIRKPGFRTVDRAGIQLHVADRVTLDLALVLGDLSQAVEVSASAPLLKTTTGTVSFVVDQAQIASLPLDGRNFIPLIALAPGVMLPPGQFLPRINGSRPRTSEYLYDGVSVLQPEPGQVAYYPVLDSIDEFRVDTNSYSAEYGRSNGGVIQVSSKSGTNDLHGSLFEYFRNEALNARNLFAAPGPKPLFRRNLFGATLGGPVRHNRTFFFADWQGSRLATGVTRLGAVPTAAQRQGVFSTAIIDPATRASLSRSHHSRRALRSAIQRFAGSLPAAQQQRRQQLSTRRGTIPTGRTSSMYGSTTGSTAGSVSSRDTRICATTSAPLPRFPKPTTQP